VKPRVVLVTGAPGSGKSTLARQLSIALRVPLVARDEIRGGLLFTAGAWGDSLERIPSADEAVEVFLGQIERLSSRGVSCVAEYLVRAHRPNDLARILAAGDCVVVITECEHAIERFAERNRGDLLISQPAVLDAIGCESVEAHTDSAIERMCQAESEMLRVFPVPALVVDTSDGYDPPISEIVSFATRTQL
jgi:predicted kinase